MTRWVTNRRLQTVAETPTFSRQADKLFNQDERRELIELLATSPLAGDQIPGTGGVRKMRFAASGIGKRGGARIIYYYFDERIPVYALLAYVKSARIDLTQRERHGLSLLAAELKSVCKEMK